MGNKFIKSKSTRANITMEVGGVELMQSENKVEDNAKESNREESCFSQCSLHGSPESSTKIEGQSGCASFGSIRTDIRHVFNHERSVQLGFENEYSEEKRGLEDLTEDIDEMFRLAGFARAHEYPVLGNSSTLPPEKQVEGMSEMNGRSFDVCVAPPTKVCSNNEDIFIGEVEGSRYPKITNETESEVREKFEWELPGYFEKLVDDTINKKIEESSHRTTIKFHKTMLENITESIGFMKVNECKPSIKMGFLYNHRVDPLARARLVEHLIQLHIDYNFPPSVMSRCVSYFDRYLQANKNVSTSELVAVGTIAMIMAARFETTCYLNIDKLITSCEVLYSRDETRQIEAKIMEGLHSNWLIPTSMCFLKVYNTICPDTMDHVHMSNYFLEIMLVEYGISHVRPSLQAAAAFFLSKEILRGIEFLPHIWTPNLMEITKYIYEDFANVVKKLAQILVKSEFCEQHKIVKIKYSSLKYNEISLRHELNEGNMRTIAATRRGFRKSPLF